MSGELFDATTDFAKLISGGPGPVGDYCRRLKADGAGSTPMTNQQLKESGPGFWADMARQGGAVIGSSGGLLAGLPWTAGAVTTMTIAGGFVRATAVDFATNNPRVLKGPFNLQNGQVYTFSGKMYQRTAATNMYLRVSLTPTLAAGDFFQRTVGGSGVTVDLTGVTFVANQTAPAYVGIIPVVGANGEYGEIDNGFDIT